MDIGRFDALARTLSDPRSRRSALLAGLGGAVGLFGHADTMKRWTSPPPPVCDAACEGNLRVRMCASQTERCDPWCVAPGIACGDCVTAHVDCCSAAFDSWDAYRTCMDAYR